jgi:uncharacterized protein
VTGQRTNHLANATSPYLLQHATNPVEWYPWSERAFALARERDVPVFLSVGYAACHWCHVMERESFEDAATADLMNAHFVSIKVDREERPDIDSIYMGAVQAMTGSGGWPMSVFCTPEGRPFFAGTYYPDTPRHGLPSFRQVLQGIAEVWATRRDDAEAQGARLAQALADATRASTTAPAFDDTRVDEAFRSLERDADRTWGGFGSAPKFPQPMVLAWLLRQHVRGREGALELVTRTLDRMAAGGIHDHLDGGFARYSTDDRWHVPHFEKMLPDNALLLQLYAQAWLVTRKDRYRDIAISTADYLLDSLRRPEGGFSSSQDADTAGVEGATYTWKWGELVAIVGEPVADRFGARPEGNWEGTNVLWMPEDVQVVAARRGIPSETLAAAVKDGRKALLAQRRRRPQPAVDDKVVTAWNGLAISALAIAGRSLAAPRYVEAALDCATFIWTTMRDADGRLARAWRGQISGPGFLDDHALLALGFLALYETTGEFTWFSNARSIIADIGERFSDPNGGFFLGPTDGQPLISRPKDVFDNPTPSGTSASADALLRMARFTNDQDLESQSWAALAPALTSAGPHPEAFGHALCVADMLLGPPLEIAIIGDPALPEAVALADVVFKERFLPDAVIAMASAGDRATREIPLLTGRGAVDGKPTAYVCERFTCRTPTTDTQILRDQLTR